MMFTQLSCSDNDSATAPLPEPSEYALPLMQTSDIHGCIVSIEDDVVHYKLARVNAL